MDFDKYIKNKKNRPIAFIPMCLDPLHHGHINIIKEAKKYGNVVLGLMTDEGMISYKRKPLINFEGRLKVANELKSVSFVLPIDGINYASIASKYNFEFFWIEILPFLLISNTSHLSNRLFTNEPIAKKPSAPPMSIKVG